MIALIVLVALTLAGISLVRSVDTSNVIAGNLSFKRGAIQSSEVSVNTARTVLSTGALASVSATEADLPSQNYSAVVLPITNSHGIPDVLLDKTAFDANAKFTHAKIVNSSTNEEMRYVIERLCTRPGTFDPHFCISLTQDSNAGSHNKSKLNLSTGSVFRITVRVDGARNTVSYSQTSIQK